MARCGATEVCGATLDVPPCHDEKHRGQPGEPVERVAHDGPAVGSPLLRGGQPVAVHREPDVSSKARGTYAWYVWSMSGMSGTCCVPLWRMSGCLALRCLRHAAGRHNPWRGYGYGHGVHVNTAAGRLLGGVHNRPVACANMKWCVSAAPQVNIWRSDQLSDGCTPRVSGASSVESQKCSPASSRCTRHSIAASDGCTPRVSGVQRRITVNTMLVAASASVASASEAPRRGGHTARNPGVSKERDKIR